MYWTDPSEGVLYRASLKGKHKEKIVTGASSISGVACTEDRVYYTVIVRGSKLVEVDEVVVGVEVTVVMVLAVTVVGVVGGYGGRV